MSSFSLPGPPPGISSDLDRPPTWTSCASGWWPAFSTANAGTSPAFLRARVRSGGRLSHRPAAPLFRRNPRRRVLRPLCAVPGRTSASASSRARARLGPSGTGAAEPASVRTAQGTGHVAPTRSFPLRPRLARLQPEQAPQASPVRRTRGRAVSSCPGICGNMQA